LTIAFCLGYYRGCKSCEDIAIELLDLDNEIIDILTRENEILTKGLQRKQDDIQKQLKE